MHRPHRMFRSEILWPTTQEKLAADLELVHLMLQVTKLAFAAFCHFSFCISRF
jgi:hypothetical protein